MKSYMTDEAYKELGRITEEIFVENNDRIKSESICSIPIAGSSKKCGKFHLDYTGSSSAIGRVRSQNNADTDSGTFYYDRDQALAELMNNPEFKKFKKGAKALYLSIHDPNLTQEEIARKVRFSSHAKVSAALRQIYGKLSEMSGRPYEEYKTRNLLGRHYEVTHGGADSEPDIYGKNAAGLPVAISCKCKDFTRVCSIDPLEEMRPEIEYARKNGSGLILSVFNLHNRHEGESAIDVDHLPKFLRIDPDKCKVIEEDDQEGR